MKYLKRFNKTSDYDTFKSGEDYVTPNITYINEIKGFRFNPKIKPVTPPSEPTLAMAGDVAYWDGSKVKTAPLSSWNTSLGTPVGVVVVPEGFAPDGKVRIISLKYVDASGNTSTSYESMKWSNVSVDTSLTNFTKVPTTDNNGSTSTGSSSYGYLPSDNFTGATSFVDPKAKYSQTSNLIPSPYLGDVPNPEYNKEISGYNNALSDFNGLSNTETLIGLGEDYVAANAAYKYNDGASNLQWYLPAMGEFGYLMPRFNEINSVITALGGVAVASDYFWSSSEYSSYCAYGLGTYDGIVDYVGKGSYSCVRPFTTLDDGGGDSLFPITLVVGENGQKGIDLYEYYMSQAPENQITSYIPTAKEKITVEGEEVIGITIGKGWMNYFQLCTPTFEDYPYVLHHNGELLPPED